MNDCMTDVFDRLAEEAGRLTQHSKHVTLTSREMQVWGEGLVQVCCFQLRQLSGQLHHSAQAGRASSAIVPCNPKRPASPSQAGADTTAGARAGAGTAPASAPSCTPRTARLTAADRGATGPAGRARSARCPGGQTGGAAQHELRISCRARSAATVAPAAARTEVDVASCSKYCWAGCSGGDASSLGLAGLGSCQ